MFNPLACVAPRFRQRHDDDEEGGAAEGELEGASPCSTTSLTPSRCSLSPTKGSGKKGSNKIWSRNSNLNRNRKEKNPFSTRGLEKFSTLLADLEERRRKIYALVGSHSHPKDGVPNYVVQFICSNSGDWVPIVVRLRDHNRQSQSHGYKHKHNKHKHDKTVANSVGVCGLEDKPQKGQGSTQNLPPILEAQAPGPDDHYPPPSRCTTTATAAAATTTTTTTTTTPINNNNNNNNNSTCSRKASSPQKVAQLQQQQQQQEDGKQVTPATSASASASASNKKKKSQNSLQRWRRPSQYLPVVLVLTLVCLVMFGRSVAILLTSACWYLIPTIKTPSNPNPNPNPKRSSSFVKKEEYATRLSTTQRNGRN